MVRLGELARRLKYYRKMRNLSVRQLAHLARVSVSYVYAIESGARGSNAAKLGQIAEALGVRLSDLWGDTEHHE
ncbi:helix-turn-helix transcriptional regulator [Alicyclobacillus fastidiosus]|uniref:Helix-turn-helix transcriptional regulator n=1 Tax=Alicyclobacillus fastidiosus TaxID=392011 RepID=A0ABY6ZJ43_9BACL|nr:helix-turn-helix transcriptional regulator [Alicyclobacillus fastidiosus]WAH42856.1 helix-turn-helix transcriptional regulator [Alicyclobacillus fastidiosus]